MELSIQNISDQKTNEISVFKDSSLDGSNDLQIKNEKNFDTEEQKLDTNNNLTKEENHQSKINGETTLKNEEIKNNEPDPDAIKMFVGQIPRTWTEKECTSLFEEFGKIFNIKVLRDRDAKYSKGCCFVTFYERKSSLKAQDALHNIRILPGMHHPIQMRPADSENLHERKLYVSMLNKNMCEKETRDLFKPYGHVEDVNVLKDSTGSSKGSAFVIFANKSSAFAAIKALNQKKILDGCTSPLIVRIAENQKERDARRQMMLLQQVCHLNNAGSTQIVNCQAPSVFGLANPLYNVNYLNGFNSMAYASLPSLNTNTLVTSPAITANNQITSTDVINNLTSNQNSKSHQDLKMACSTITSPSLLNETSINNSTLNQPTANTNHLQSSTTALSNQNQSAQQLAHLVNFKNFFCLDQTYPYCTANSQALSSSYLSTDNSSLIKPLTNLQTNKTNKYSSTLFTNVLPTLNCSQNNLTVGNHLSNQATQYIDNTSNYSLLATKLKTPSNSALPFQTLPNQMSLLINNSPTNKKKQVEGPDGSNLFIYHLPAEFTDIELLQAFSPFGNILSCKVYIDKNTKLSKCFGFVSYDNAASAQAAIQAMNGFHVSNKRLKVQLKKVNKQPYERK